MSKASVAAKKVASESNPVTFTKRLREMPVMKRVMRVIDRFV